jgi:hypothetical protein
MFTSRPGTNTTFRIGPVTYFAMPGSARAAATASSCVAVLETVIVPRV